MKLMMRFLEGDNKYRFTLVLLLSLFVIIVAIAIILSNVKFEKKVDGTIATVLNEGDLVINYVDGHEVYFNDSKEHTYGITITNNSNEVLYYSIYFESANIDNIKVKIKDKDGNVLKSLKEDITEEKLINLYSINGGETVRYTVVIDSDIRIKFKGVLKVENDSMTTETFSDLILLYNQVGVAKTRIGSEIATEKEGLLSTIDNKGTTYYFRGKINNNYLKLGDLLFRIVRINGDGTVRLVLENTIDGQVPYNSNPLAEGADVSSLVVFKDATVINTLNNWVNTKLAPYKSYLVNGDYCTDTSFNLDVNGTRYSSTYERIFNDEAPDLYCSGQVYSGIVGLLSVDEVVLAGASGSTPNTSYYLYNKNIQGNYLTTSSYFVNSNNNASVMNVMSNGAIGDGILVTYASYLRPVINISVSANIKGEGTIDNPYIIVS